MHLTLLNDFFTPEKRHSVFDSMLDDLFFSSSVHTRNSLNYELSTTESGNFKITLEIPGFTKEHVEVEQIGNRLLVKGKKEKTIEDIEYKILHSNRRVTSTFEKTFKLPKHTKIEDVSLTDGVLVVKGVKEVPEEEKPKKLLIS